MRKIVHRTRGTQHGFIGRMVSPGDLGSHSVHTSDTALRQGVARIRAVGAALRAEGRF